MQKSWCVFITSLFITSYRNTLSPGHIPACRFVPTCSQYAVGAVRSHGLLKGWWLTLRRLLRCQPLSPGGYDPVP